VIVRAETDAVVVQEAEDLRSLSIVLADNHTVLGQVGTRDDDGEHVWLRISELRRLAGEGQPPEWGDGFDAMIGYAASKGWLDADGASVRVHVDRS
jgi:hypothetical protein